MGERKQLAIHCYESRFQFKFFCERIGMKSTSLSSPKLFNITTVPMSYCDIMRQKSSTVLFNGA